MRNVLEVYNVDPEEEKRLAAFADLLPRSPKSHEEMNEALSKVVPGLKAQYPPLERLLCAKAIIHNVCNNPGTKACAACKLVSYCSAKCQKEHWKTHKQDCKNPMRTEDWLPDWAVEGRSPSFMDQSPGQETLSPNDPKYGRSLTIGVALWGNTPAVDVLNLAKNENSGTRDYSIAFPASGDLRHVVKTVNSLPSDFSGKLSFVLNDGNPYVATRNVALLAILATVADDDLAADIALHLWYSAFIPMEYNLHIAYALSCWANQSEAMPLGQRSRMVAVLSSQDRQILAAYARPPISVEEAQAECDRVKHAPGRKDLRDRYYYKLKPSHRVAYQEFRRFGILLPFGAVNHHFNVPNASMFSKNGMWLQSDFAEPLNGWDVQEVLNAGKRHGATHEDIYGCLYFHISEQLRTFVRRLRTFDISFTLLASEACHLASSLARQRQNAAGSSHVFPDCFDRIFLSNITDANYVGLRKALESWAPLLSKGQAATIVAYFMNWPFIQRDGRVRDAGEKALEEVTERYMERTDGKRKLEKLKSNPILFAKRMSADLPYILSASEAFYDNSQPFQRYLEGQGLEAVLRTTNLSLRKNHTIVPHRLGLTLEAPIDTLPYLSYPDDESWYNYGVLGSFTWVERFVEFGRE